MANEFPLYAPDSVVVNLMTRPDYSAFNFTRIPEDIHVTYSVPATSGVSASS